MGAPATAHTEGNNRIQPSDAPRRPPASFKRTSTLGSFKEVTQTVAKKHKKKVFTTTILVVIAVVVAVVVASGVLAAVLTRPFHFDGDARTAQLAGAAMGQASKQSLIPVRPQQLSFSLLQTTPACCIWLVGLEFGFGFGFGFGFRIGQPPRRATACWQRSLPSSPTPSIAPFLSYVPTHPVAAPSRPDKGSRG